MTLLCILQDQALAPGASRCFGKMKVSSTLSPLLLLLLLSGFSWSVELISALAVHGGSRAVRIPEHTCHKLVDSGKCDLQTCIQECSKEPHGVGICKDTSICFCTYYCKQPPV